MNNCVIVDGYNVIYAWTQLDELKNENLEHARDKLVETLSNYSALSGEKIYIVFDAHQVKDSMQHKEEKDSINIIYTKEGETADAVIEKMAGELSGNGRVYVVTSDYDEQRIIFGQGAYRLTPSDLQQRVQQYRSKEEEWTGKNKIQYTYLESRLSTSLRHVLEAWRQNKK
ncbi:MAG: NYN domain-containing protein [Clostridiales bacterium]|nr:NYN domain-containing protein [Clostridiales bacterium]MCF8023645.1 NYN domain-containing protein [Clostridiales bacterium]